MASGDFPVGLREVTPNQTVPQRFREFVVNTGGSQSTLQDIKLPDCSGGFSYTDKERAVTRNRFISWRVSGDVLELVETSLDWPLIGARVRYRFADTPLLSGVTVHETFPAIVVLVATVSSVHKMSFVHPNRIHKQDFHLYQDDGIPSIFADAGPLQAKEHFHVIPAAGTSPMPHTAGAWLTCDEEAVFALANAAGNVTVVKLGNVRGIVTVNDLSAASYLGRLWGNIGGMLSRAADGSDAAISLSVHPIETEPFVFGLCKDHKLRMWSAVSFECVMVSDVLSFAAEDAKSLQQGSQNHILKKLDVAVGPDAVTGSSSRQFALAAFLCFSQHSQFIVLRPTRASGRFQLEHIATVYAPKLDLIDFSVTATQLWALWTNADGEPVLRYASFLAAGASVQAGVGCASASGWSDVILEAPPDPDAVAPLPAAATGGATTHVDPRQAFLHQLFHPGRFSVLTINKTLNIYRRIVLDMSNSSAAAPTDDSMSRLREDVCAAVEAEIANSVTEYEISAEEYLEITHNAWARFYSCAIQYHQAGLKPMGIVCDVSSGLLVVLKKEGFSFVRPVDALEHLVLAEGLDVSGPELFHDTPVLCEDAALAQDVIGLMRAVALVGALIPAQLADEFEHALHRLASPDNVARSIAKAILTQASGGGGGGGEGVISAAAADGAAAMDATAATAIDPTQELATRLQQVGDVARALEILLQMLELDRGIVADKDFDLGSLPDDDDDEGRLFGSPVGVSVVAESLHQMAATRFALTRDVIVLQILMLECGVAANGVSPRAAELIHSTYLPRSVVMAHCYYVLVWLTETTASVPPANALEQGLRQMAVLKIADRHASQGVVHLARNTARPLTLSELFLNGPGGRARALLTGSGCGHAAPWHTVLLPLVNVSAQLLWPRCAVPRFQEFLLTACQYTQIQEYVRLLSTWCDWHCNSRQFLLGSALLNMAEPEKAADWMTQAAGGVATDQFLISQLFSSEDVPPEKLTVLYFLKVIQLFEQFGYFDFVIEIAKTAAAVADANDPERATLCYILFSYHLKLGHNDEAYDAMIANPDQTRRKDSLRQFVVTLFERRQLKQLARYPFINMFQDLEQIIEARARSVDLKLNDYYQFLYSFHVTKLNYRKAAHVMYECGMRLATEDFSHDGLKKQVKCYLACLNALKLVNPAYAWIVKPVPHTRNPPSVAAELPPGVSPKRSVEGDELALSPFPSDAARPRMDVLELAEIEREFELLCARLKLANRAAPAAPAIDAPVTSPGLTADETVALLVSANLFEDGVRICKLFQLDLRSTVEGLAARCVKLTRAKASDQDAAWDWLAENNPSGADVRGSSAVEAAWKLLEDLIGRLEEGKQSHLHKAAVTRLFSMGVLPPTWLVASYKKRNPSELLRLYLCHGYLESATLLAIEYVAAVLGSGKEYFGLAESINANAQPVWLPYNTLDQLLLELRDRLDNPEYARLYDELSAQLDGYLATAERVSMDMIELRRA